MFYSGFLKIIGPGSGSCLAQFFGCRGTHGFVCDDYMVPLESDETRECHSEAKATPEFDAREPRSSTCETKPQSPATWFVFQGAPHAQRGPRRGTHGFVCDDSMVPLESDETRECRSEAKATPEFDVRDETSEFDNLVRVSGCPPCAKGAAPGDSWVRLRRLHGSPRK